MVTPTLKGGPVSVPDMALSYRPSDLADSEEEDDQVFHTAILASEENDPNDWTYVELMENGGDFVDWCYWLSLPVWNALQAACLLNGIDPFVSDGTRPRAEPLLTARKITSERMARIEAYETAAIADATAGSISENEPVPDWIAWARARDFPIWPGLQNALDGGIPKKITTTKSRNAKLQSHAEKIARERKRNYLPSTKMLVVKDLLKDGRWRDISENTALRNVKKNW